MTETWNGIFCCTSICQSYSFIKLCENHVVSGTKFTSLLGTVNNLKPFHLTFVPLTKWICQLQVYFPASLMTLFVYFDGITSRMENSVDPDQLASKEKPADQDLHCFRRGHIKNFQDNGLEMKYAYYSCFRITKGIRCFTEWFLQYGVLATPRARLKWTISCKKVCLWVWAKFLSVES